MFALVTAVVGLIIFVILYFQNIEGRLEEAIRDPKTIAMVLMPFLPAVVLSIMAERAQKKFVDYMQNTDFSGAGAAAAVAVLPADGKKKK